MLNEDEKKCKLLPHDCCCSVSVFVATRLYTKDGVAIVIIFIQILENIHSLNYYYITFTPPLKKSERKLIRFKSFSSKFINS